MRFTFNDLYDDVDLKNEMLSGLLQYSASEVIISDDKFNIIYNNSKLITDNKKHKLLEVLNPLMNKNIKSTVENFKNSDKKHIFLKLIVSVDGAGDFPINVHITKLCDKQNCVKGFCVFIQDITQEIKAKIQKETFIDIISHDLRTPMRANIQVLELIMQGKFGKLDESVKPILDELLSSCRFMNYMAENLLIKYKNEFSSASINTQKYSMINLVKAVCGKLNYILERKKQNVELVVQGKIPDADIDTEKIGKVINNLIINASEQSKESSSIMIQIANKDDNIEVSFTDNGYPKKDENIMSIFDEYINCSNKFRKIGFGLEMYNCKKIIEAHKGSIRAENMDSKRMSVIFSLPVHYICCAN